MLCQTFCFKYWAYGKNSCVIAYTSFFCAFYFINQSVQNGIQMKHFGFEVYPLWITFYENILIRTVKINQKHFSKL